MASRRDLVNNSSIVRRPQVSLAALTGALVAENGEQLGIVMVEDGSVTVGSFRLTPTGLQVDASASETEWEQVGRLLRRLEGSLQWLIGDWFLFAETSWGTTYQAVAAATGYDEKTLRNYAWVARNVEMSLRKDKLSFGHHNLVAGLEPEQQVTWLNWAVESGASVPQLRRAMRADGGNGGDDPPAPPSPEALQAVKFGQYVQTELPRISQMDARQRNEMARRASWLAQYYDGIARQAREG